MHRTTRRPLGHATRGKTAPGRLVHLDRFLMLAMESWLRNADEHEVFLDLGYGFWPGTTLESAARFRRRRPGLKVVGVEIDQERVDQGKPYVDARTQFRRGGFEVPLVGRERVGLLRAMNVLRQYPPDAVEDAHQRMLSALTPTGLLAEGTCTPGGEHLVVNLLGPGRPPRVLFAVRPQRVPSSPRDLQAILPKDHIHRMRSGEPVHDLMEAWERAWERERHHATFGPLCHWAAAGRRLMDERDDVERRPGLLRKGYLIWRPPSS